jgi:Ceramidase
MSRKVKQVLLVVSTLVVTVVVFCLPHIPQSTTYHHFCDERRLLGIPDFANVVSNVVFLVTGVAGFLSLKKAAANSRIKLIYSFVFAGVVLTGLGSAYYHSSPDNATLVFDRLPMTIVFMGLVAAVIAEGIGVTAGTLLLGPLLIVGIGSVIWWHVTESRGAGDLRLYVLVQYYPLALIPAILLLFPGEAIARGWPSLLWAFGWYGLAKVAESADCGIYHALGVVSGHTLKHLGAGISTWLLVKRFRVMYSPSIGLSQNTISPHSGGH